MIIIARDTDNDYYLIEEASEVDEFKIGSLNFFHLYGIVDYRETFKIWLRKFPRPIFITAVRGDTIVGFIYVDAWEELPFVVNVLRAQETEERLRGKKIGYKLFLLGAYLTSEYMITKPLTEQSRNFYKKLGFEDISQIPLFGNYHQVVGYMGLPTDKKREHVAQISSYFTALSL